MRNVEIHTPLPRAPQSSPTPVAPAMADVTEEVQLEAFELRRWAVEQAVRLSTSADAPEDVVDMAYKFEEYVKRGAVPPTGAQPLLAPEAKPQPGLPDDIQF